MSRLRIVAALSLVFALVLPAVAHGAAVPAGPRLTFFEAEIPGTPIKAAAKEEEKLRLVGTDPEGGDWRPLLEAGSLRVLPSTVSWDADGGEFAFRGKRPGPGPGRVYVAGADGTGAHPIAGTTGALQAVLSPDGQQLAFSRVREHHPRLNPKNPDGFLESLTHSYTSWTTWIVPTAGGRPRRLTPWGNGRLSVPTSFSPDGSTLAVTVERIGAKPEVDAIDLGTGARRTLQVEASEAAYSPDGSEIAFVSYRDHEAVPGFDEPEATSELYVSAADGSGAHRITHTPRLQESGPSWDPSGARLAYLRASGGMLGLIDGKVVESNADGSCAKAISTPAPRREGDELLFGEPTWQPGPGRSAAPLSC